MDKDFENSEKSSASFVYRRGVIFRVVFVIVFLCILSIVGFFIRRAFCKRLEWYLLGLWQL